MTSNPPPRPDPASIRQLHDLFRKHGFHPRRALGQTFLTDGNIARKIVRAAGLTGRQAVVEIGAGAGAVTRELAGPARRVVAIEIDPKLVAILRETLGETAEVLQADVLTLDWAEVLAPEDAGPWRAVANLPYAITGPALLRLAEARRWVDRAVVMVQAEVAERLIAPPGGRARGMLSVLLQVLFRIESIARVPRTCFWPQPRVDSTILRLDLRRPALLSHEAEPALRRVLRAAFGTRRKILLNALAGSRELALSREEARAALSRCAIDPGRRAEALTEEEFLRLAGELGRLEREGAG